MLNRGQDTWPTFITHHAPNEVFLACLSDNREPIIIHPDGHPPSICFIQVSRKAMVAVPLRTTLSCFAATGLSYRGNIGEAIGAAALAHHADTGEPPLTLDVDEEYPVIVLLEAMVRISDLFDALSAAESDAEADGIMGTFAEAPN